MPDRVADNWELDGCSTQRDPKAGPRREQTMTESHSVSRPVSGTDKTLSFESGKLAGLADGAVTVTMGDTMVLVTATASRSVREGADFFPLTVDIEERFYAAGKIPGSFFRREGKSSDQAILTCRLIDRPLRPSFPEGFRNEVHVVGTILGADQENPHDILAINAASAALCISPIPFDGPLGAVRLAFTPEGTWIAYPTWEEGKDSTFEMVVAGRLLDDGDVAVMMVEAGGGEHAWQLYEAGAPKVTEEIVAAGLEASKSHIKDAIELQQELIDAVGGKPEVFEFTVAADYSDEVFAAVEAAATDRVAETYQIADKAERTGVEDEMKAAVVAELLPQFEDVAGAEKQIKAAIRSLTKKVVRKRIVEDGIRIDGRGTRDVRPLSSEVHLVPTAHGSGLFQRGETQVLNVATLGMPRMEQMLDSLGGDTSKRYMHHYNFPPFSTGETGFMRGPKRREIGHGLLAERALLPVIPPVGGVQLHAAHRVRRAELQRLHLDGLGLCLDPVADGRRCADQGPRGRHRHGPRLRRGQVHRPHRHPRGRGRLRRHGLQGGRDERVRHRPAAGHQDRRHPRRRPGLRPAAGLRGPHADPRGHAVGHPRAPGRRRRHGAEDHQLPDPDRQDR